MAEGEPELVRFETDGEIGVITVDNPPVNGPSPGCVRGGRARASLGTTPR